MCVWDFVEECVFSPKKIYLNTYQSLQCSKRRNSNSNLTSPVKSRILLLYCITCYNIFHKGGNMVLNWNGPFASAIHQIRNLHIDIDIGTCLRRTYVSWYWPLHLTRGYTYKHTSKHQLVYSIFPLNALALYTIIMGVHCTNVKFHVAELKLVWGNDRVHPSGLGVQKVILYCSGDVHWNYSKANLWYICTYEEVKVIYCELWFQNTLGLGYLSHTKVIIYTLFYIWIEWVLRSC